MTAASTSYTRYSEAIRQELDDGGELALLGSLCWFSIHDNPVRIDTIEKRVAELGMSDTWLRTKIRPVDAFRKTAKTFAKRFPKTKSGIQSTFLVRPAGQDRDTAHRHVILERIRTEKGKKRKLLYTPVVELVFYRGQKKNGQYINHTLEVTVKEPAMAALSDVERNWINEHLRNVQTTFDMYMTHLDGEALRVFVRNYLLNEQSGVCVKPSGGVYFVQADHEDGVRGLQTICQEQGNFFHMLPLVDMAEQRDMVIQAFEDEAIGEVQRMSAEIADILNDPSRKVRSETVNDRMQKAGEIIAKADNLAGILDRKVDRVHTQVSLFKQQVLQLAGQIE